MLDTTRRVATPEGIELTLRLAGPVPRALAWSVDFAAARGVVLRGDDARQPLGRAGWGVVLIAAFFVEWLLPAWFEARWGGQTPGKRLFRLAVLNDDGTPVRWPGALTRNLLRAADFLPFLYGVGLITMLMNRDFKRLGDLAAGTVVVYQAEKVAAARAIPQAPPHAAAAVALAGGAARGARPRRALGDASPRERFEELAELPTPLVGRAVRDAGGGAHAQHRELPGGQAMKQAPFEAAHAAEWDEFEKFLDKPNKLRSTRPRCRRASAACARASRSPPSGTTAPTSSTG